MDTSNYPINKVLHEFAHLVIELREQRVGYSPYPVNQHSDWDMLKRNSIQRVISINGTNAPDNSRFNVDWNPYGIVMTFGKQLTGNYQLALGSNIIAFRIIGDTTHGDSNGWQYLDPNDRSKPTHRLTVELLNHLLRTTTIKGYVDTVSNQDINGRKNFTNGLTVEGHTPALHDTVQKLFRRYAHKLDSLDKQLSKFKKVAQLPDGGATFTSQLASVASSASDAVNSNTTNIYYLNGNKADQDSFESLVHKVSSLPANGGNSTKSLENSVNNLNNEAMSAKDSLSSLSNDNVSLRNQLVNDNNHNSSEFHDEDLGKIKATIHKIDLRASTLSNSVSANANTLSSLKPSYNSFAKQNDVDAIVGDLKRIKATIHKIDLRNGNTHSMASSNIGVNSNVASSLSNAVNNDNTNLSAILADVRRMKSTIHKMNTRAMDDNKSNASNSSVGSLSSDAANAWNETKAVVNDIKSMKATQHKTDLRAEAVHASLSNAEASLSSATSGTWNEVNHIVGDMKNIKNTIHKGDIRASNADNRINSLSSAVSLNASRANSNDSDVYSIKHHIAKADKRNEDAINSLSSNTGNQTELNELSNSVATIYGHMPSGISTNASQLNNDANLLYRIKQSIRRGDKRDIDAANSLSSVDYELSNGISTNASRLNSSASDTYKLKQSFKRSNQRNLDATSSLSTANNQYSSDIAELTSRVSNNASRANSVDSDMYRTKQTIKRINQRDLDAVKSLSVKPNDSINQGSLTNTLSSLANDISTNSSRLNNNNTDVYKLKQAFKRSNKRNLDAIKSLASKPNNTATVLSPQLSNSINTNYINNEKQISKTSGVNSLQARTYFNQAEADNSLLVNALANKVNALESTVNSLRTNLKK